MERLKEMLDSKKFRAALGGSIAAIIAAALGAQGWNTAMQELVLLAAIYTGAQGIADHGKEAEKEKKK